MNYRKAELYKYYDSVRHWKSFGVVYVLENGYRSKYDFNETSCIKSWDLDNLGILSNREYLLYSDIFI